MPYIKTEGQGLALVVGLVFGTGAYVFVNYIATGSSSLLNSSFEFVKNLFCYDIIVGFIKRGLENNDFIKSLVALGTLLFAIGFSYNMLTKKVRYTDWAQCTSWSTKYSLSRNDRCPNCGSDIYKLY